jgi:predicted esterase
VLRSRPAAATLVGAPPYSATTVLYHSRTVTGADEIVSGTVFTPTSPGAGTTLLSLAPGTQGLGPQCAPSKQFVAGTEYESTAVTTALRQGWTVAVTDYDGYTNGGRPTYTTGPAEAHAVLDMARAATKLPGARATTTSPLLLQGYSQGGGAAGWAASLAPSYAPELKLKAAATGGVPNDLQAVGQTLDRSANEYFGLLGLVGLNNAYPDAFHLDSRLNARGQAVFAGLRSDCVGGLSEVATAFTSISDYLANGETAQQLAAEPKIAAVFRANLLAAQPAPRVPTYQSHAAADEIVQLAQAQQLHATWCSEHVTTRLDLLPGEHVTGGVESIVPFTAWLQAVAHGLPVPTAC